MWHTREASAAPPSHWIMWIERVVVRTDDKAALGEVDTDMENMD